MKWLNWLVDKEGTLTISNLTNYLLLKAHFLIS